MIKDTWCTTFAQNCHNLIIALFSHESTAATMGDILCEHVSYGKRYFFKNGSFSTSHKKTPSLREFKNILPSTIIYEPILMNADIMKTQIEDMKIQKKV